MKHLHAASLLALSCAAAHVPTMAQEPGRDMPGSRVDVVQITATRFGEPVQEVPTSISVVTAEELVARGAHDLRTALALLGGVSVASGGDAGPAGAVPGLLGLREVDDLLLLIDGVPAGGAFSPPFETVSLTNVERIEVLRGSAPVYFGTTAFAGTINVIHYAAGRASGIATLSDGSRGSASVSLAKALTSGAVNQSISVEASRERLADPRAGFKRAQGSYRLAAELGGGRVRMDVNLLVLRQRPGSPAPVGDAGQLDAGVPIDFNQNPADAGLATHRQQLVLGYAKPVPFGEWGTTLSFTRTRFEGIQGFLVEDGLALQGDNATGARQSRRIRDLYVDTHLTGSPRPWLNLTWGVNELVGHASQASDTFSYRTAPGEAEAPDSSSATPQDHATLEDRRGFLGLYAQSRAALWPDLTLLAGLRWNRTAETRRTGEDGDPPRAEMQRNSRLSGSIGAQWRAWRDAAGDLDDVSLYANAGNTFQPSQLDFGADAGSQPLLRPETQRSLAFGMKVDGADGRFDLDLAAFVADFANQAVARQAAGSPVLQSGGSQRYRGAEIETSFRPTEALTLVAHASHALARYRSFATLVGGELVALDGRLLPMTPRTRFGAGVVLAPRRGWGFSLTANHTGRRYLDSLNTAAVGGVNVIDASVAYRYERGALSFAASNVTDRRDPVLPSELGEGQFYRMSGRRVSVSLSASI